MVLKLAWHRTFVPRVSLYVYIQLNTHCGQPLVEWQLGLKWLCTMLLEHIRDYIVWHRDSLSTFTFALAYRWLLRDNTTQTSLIWKKVWKFHGLEIKFFLWQILYDALPSNHKWWCHLTASPTCMRCTHHVEDTLHIFHNYPKSREIWLCIGLVGIVGVSW